MTSGVQRDKKCQATPKKEMLYFLIQPQVQISPFPSYNICGLFIHFTAVHLDNAVLKSLGE